MARRLTALVWLLALTSCSQPEPTGSAQLFGSLQQAATALDITRVEVTITAPDLAPRTEALGTTNGVWGGTLGNIPSGQNRTFSAEAFDAAGTKRFAGQATGVTITAGQTTVVALTLQEVGPPAPPFDNAAPLIDSLVAATATVTPGGYLSIAASAHDPDPGDTLSYSWSSTAGGFYAPTSPSTTWWAPTQQGPVTLTLTVADSRGATATLNLTIQVVSAGGAAAVHITFNSTPAVSRITASPSRVDAGETTTVVATAADGDGDALSYQWTAACAGTWSSPSSATAQFTPSSRPASGTCADCPLAVTVTDARGGQTTGTFHICVGPSPATHFPPYIVSTYQSSQSVPASGTVTLRVLTSDPQASALTFTWSALAGTLGAPSSDATRSEVQWTPPACVATSSPLSITATVVNALGLSTSTSFTLTGGTSCASGLGGFRPTGDMADGSNRVLTLLPSGKVLALSGTSTTAEVYDPATETWSSGSMPSGHSAATATLLVSGQVLVVRGDSAAAELYDPATGIWTPTGSPQMRRNGATATRLLSGKVLVVGGGDSSSSYATAELYDPATGTWASAGTLWGERVLHTATLLPSGKVLVIGGPISSTAELYDPVTGSWTLTGGLAARYFFHTATLLPSGQVLITGGEITGDAAEVYDEATGSWTATSPMSKIRSRHTATLLPSGKVLVTGGQFGFSSTASAETYDPLTRSWSPTGGLLVSRLQHTALLLPSGTVLVVGGQFNVRFAELYEPTLGVWTPTQSMSVARIIPTATVLSSGQVLVAGGESASAELYNAATGSWTLTGSMAAPRVAHTATLLPSGKVLVAGGVPTPSTELYDPSTGTWLPTGDMGEVRYQHTATLLLSGKVLVMGGYLSNTAELYDPVTAAWTPTGSMSEQRERHTATLLPSGQVLVVGGNAGANPLVATAELYDPSTGTWSPTAPPLSIAPNDPTATSLLSGKVLVTGRDGFSEEYDPASGTWTASGRMRWGLVGRRAVRLPSGKVLLTGGGLQGTAELYEPATRTWSVIPGSMFTVRSNYAQVLLPSGQVLITGGFAETDFTSSAELYGP